MDDRRIEALARQKKQESSEEDQRIKLRVKRIARARACARAICDVAEKHGYDILPFAETVIDSLHNQARERGLWEDEDVSDGDD